MPTTTLPTGVFTLDPARTTVSVTVKKLGFITVTGALDVTSGRIHIDESGSVTSVDVTVDAGSYATGNDKRDTHVRSGDFLDVEHHPEMTFHAEGLSTAGDGYTADGTVSVKGATAPLSFAVADVTSDAAGGSFTATCTVDRNAIGVDKMPSLIIGKTLQIEISAVATAAGE